MLLTLAAYSATATIPAAPAPHHRRSFMSTATITLVHAFITARRDCCSTLYSGLPAVRLGCLERVIRTVARLIGGIFRTGRISNYIQFNSVQFIDHFYYSPTL